MRTPYSSKNAKFSNDAHAAAQSLIYPRVFGLPLQNLEFEDTLLNLNKRGEALDGQMAIDRIVKVTARAGLKQPLTFTVQERFRKPHFLKYQDITITEWNHNSNLPSELYKITANIFVYGYFDGVKFLDYIAANVTSMLSGICNNTLAYTRKPNPKNNQTFIGVKFSALSRAGCLIYWQRGSERGPVMKQAILL